MITAIALLLLFLLLVALIAAATALVEDRGYWRSRAELLAADQAAIVARLAEVLEDHADCPVPVEVTEPATAERPDLTIVPPSTEVGEWPAIMRVVESEVGS